MRARAHVFLCPAHWDGNATWVVNGCIWAQTNNVTLRWVGVEKKPHGFHSAGSGGESTKQPVWASALASAKRFDVKTSLGFALCTTTSVTTYLTPRQPHICNLNLNRSARQGTGLKGVMERSVDLNQKPSDDFLIDRPQVQLMPVLSRVSRKRQKKKL